LARRRLEPRARREAILRAAVEAFDDVGPDQVNLETVAERAGVSRALVYTYFTNRQGLVRAVFDRVLEDLGDELRGAIGRIATPEQRIAQWITTLAGYAQAHPNRWQVIRQTVLSHDPELGHGLDELLAHLGVEPPGADAGAGTPLALTALVGMVDWTADRLDEQGASYLARLAWAGTSGVPGAQAPWQTAADQPFAGAVDNIRNPQGCSPGVPQPTGRTVEPGTRTEG
jgi:AcrR family transcriptional regulator